MIPGSSAPISLNIPANVGTTIHNITVTASTATMIRMRGYINAPVTFRRVSRVSRICLFNWRSTDPSCPVISPVRITSIQYGSKICG